MRNNPNKRLNFSAELPLSHLERHEMGSTMNGWFMVFKHFQNETWNYTQKSLSMWMSCRIEKRFLTSLLDFGFQWKMRWQRFVLGCVSRVFKVRVIDSMLPIHRSQLCILPLLEGCDNLCFATPPDNESTEKSEESNDESGVWELPEKFCVCFVFWLGITWPESCWMLERPLEQSLSGRANWFCWQLGFDFEKTFSWLCDFLNFCEQW